VYTGLEVGDVMITEEGFTGLDAVEVTVMIALL